jgi:DNA polymerase
MITYPEKWKRKFKNTLDADPLSMSQESLRRLEDQISACRLCPLWQARVHTVPGAGPAPARIMLVGEAPGREEDLSGKPFVGRAGRLLDDALRQAGLQRSEIFITSIIKCRPPNNRKPLKREMSSCLPYLQAQMDTVRPRIICLLGNTAAAAVLGRQGIKALRGQIWQERFLVTYHPAAVLRNRNLMGEFVSDLKRLNILENK